MLIFANFWIDFIILITVLFSIIYYYCTSTFNVWKKLNVPYIRPIPLFGNYLRVALGIENPMETYRKIYCELAGFKYGGMFQMRTPYLMIRDPEIINNILIKDFSYFTDRGIYVDFKTEPLSEVLFLMNNPRWKKFRSKLSPAFSSGKLKQMFNQIEKCGHDMINNIFAELKKNPNDIDMRDVVSKYSMDVIGSCAFGLTLNVASDDTSLFRKYGKTAFGPSILYFIREICVMISPAILKILRLTFFPSKTTAFFGSVFKETKTYREQNNVLRNDIVHALIQAHQSDENSSKDESLRKYPLMFALFRVATKTYRVPNDSLIIEKGQKIIIPTFSLHYDPKYFSDPEVFNPERFSPKEKAMRPNGVYLPFGDGPRHCIGKRFAEMEMKLALVEILSKFEVEPSEKTMIPVQFSKLSVVVIPRDEKILLKLNPLSE
ncbi:probable cytochrome P450 6a18 isoform X2 [Acyrthosiphon pisum]|uniref:Cytochrome P450 n=1 Tax=Acyrthosiphon pisum TaxID=7029 RepID=A0A8R2JQ94_ACYPI|nr:probable cytochrome P450 6a18 isoform X2 [Acyrthosiphon pisum]